MNAAAKQFPAAAPAGVRNVSPILSPEMTLGEGGVADAIQRRA